MGGRLPAQVGRGQGGGLTCARPLARTPPSVPLPPRWLLLPTALITVERRAHTRRLVELHGEGNWSIIAREHNAEMGARGVGRIGKQCRERYIHHLKPGEGRGTRTPVQAAN